MATDKVKITCDSAPLIRAIKEFSRRGHLNERNRAYAVDFIEKCDDEHLGHIHQDPANSLHFVIIPTRFFFNAILEMEE